MKTHLALATALLVSASPAAFAQGSPPILSVSMTELDVLNTPLTTPLTYYAVYGANPAPLNSFAATVPVPVPPAALNAGNGPYTDTVNMWALATGTFPAGGFNYTFFVNGATIGSAILNPTTSSDPYAQGIGWTPPQPGVYYFSATATDGLGHSATSLAIEYFATGVSIVSPESNSIVPQGSSVVVQAAAAVAFGAVSRVDFYIDGGPTSGGTLIGTSADYPYSIIYTPQGNPTNIHFLTAAAYDASGTLIGVSAGPNSVIIAAPVTPLPVCVINTPSGTPTNPSIVAIPNYAASSTAAIPVVVQASSPNDITQVQLYVNGVLFQTINAVPYTFNWQPSVTGLYNLTALAYDSKNNVIASTTSTSATQTPDPTVVNIVAPPAVAITSPANGATLNGGGSATMTVSATTASRNASGQPVGITQVQFFQDGNLVGTATQPIPGSNGNLYTVTWTAVQNIDPTTGLPIASVLTAIATDGLGFSSTSPAITVTVTAGGSGGGTIVGTPPTVNLINPTNNENVVVNTPVTLSATGNAPNGNIAQIEFLVDNNVLSTATKYPYSVTWTPTNLGTYNVVAQVTDNLGDKVNSTANVVVVVPEPPPNINITSPSSGGIVTAGAGTTVVANAASPSGTISQVQFYANGLAIGTATTPPYSVTWTPLSAGVYTLTSVATDNSGESTTSSPAIVEAIASSGGLGSPVYFGQYQGMKDTGHFAFAVVDGTTGVYIGHSTSPSAASVAFYPDLAVGSGGGFSAVPVTGSASVTGVSGMLSPSNDQFIGTITQTSTNPVASGYYTGSLSGTPDSMVAAIVGYDGEIMVYVNSGGFSDAGDSTVDSSGKFTIVTPSNNTIAGTVDPSTGFFSATLTGGPGGVLLAGKVTGGTFSDGVLKNISTRGQIGAGSQNMIAGFVIGGTQPKSLLVRAVGPTLSTLGVPGAIAGTQLSVYAGSTLVASNTDGWSTDPTNANAVTTAEYQSGAFALPVGSADSALVQSFPPGAYTAIVSGTGSNTGVGIVEVYDLDVLQLFSSQKLINVSTRGNVGTGANILIGGFIINGAAPKRLLIRAAGPALSSMGVTGSLAAPRLQLMNSAGTTLRENFEWDQGNDVSLVNAAEAATGAFSFTKGTPDAAILMVLPPGTYTAEVAGANGTTGVALVEVYEVP
jgi:hypothetical protein